jgi:hypothetical protein
MLPSHPVAWMACRIRPTWTPSLRPELSQRASIGEGKAGKTGFQKRGGGEHFGQAMASYMK